MIKMLVTTSLLLLLSGLTESLDEALRNGANDVIVVYRKDGSYRATKWEAQFGKLHSPFVSREGKDVHLFVNNVPARTRMHINGGGFVQFKESSENYMTSGDIAELNLQPGYNTGKYIAEDLDESIPFSVFLYQEEDKLVFTDVDGTITESDFKGQVLPHLGIAAAHPNVVELFHKIRHLGYKVIYLTARSLSQDVETKEYLFDMLQEIEGFSLPLGPVLLSPETFISSIYTEMIEGNPDIQKTETILDVWRAFESPEKTRIMQTVVSAYGNKESDVRAYLNAGIDPNSIYIVDTSGHLVNIGSKQVGSYRDQVDNIQHIYKPINQ